MSADRSAVVVPYAGGRVVALDVESGSCPMDHAA
jgi:hypothetical protein